MNRKMFLRGLGMVLALVSSVLVIFSEPKEVLTVAEAGVYLATMSTTGLFGAWMFWVNGWGRRRSLLQSYR